MKRTIPQIDTIRALAMGAIFLHHAWPDTPTTPPSLWATLIDGAAGELALGVVFFNVMTAFLIGLPFFGDKPAPPPAFGAFVRKRLSRLCPQYYLAVLPLTAISAVVFHYSDWPGLAWATLSHLLFLDPLQFSPFNTNMAAFWWLGLLFQFTLIFPWLARLMTRPGFGPGGTCLVAAAICWPLTAWLQAKGAALPGTAWEGYAFLWTFNLPARLPEFCCGLWMAKAFREHGERGWPFDRGLTLFLVGGSLFVLLWGFLPGLPPLGHMTGAIESMLAFAVLFALPPVAALGRLPVVHRVATLSYGIYLCHQPLISFCGPFTESLPRWSLLAVVIVVAGGASVIGAVLLEKGAALLRELPHKRAACLRHQEEE